MSELKLKTYCHICAEHHKHAKLFLVGPTKERNQRTAINLSPDNDCLKTLKTEEAFRTAEARFLKRAEVPKMEGEINRIRFTPGRVSPNTFWNVCERTEQSVEERDKKEANKRLKIIDTILYPCQFL